jgi:hypothetical protein
MLRTAARTPSSRAPPPPLSRARPSRRAGASSTRLVVVASLKAESGPDSIHDWRGKQMQEAADKYFKDVWSKVCVSVLSVGVEGVCVALCCPLGVAGSCMCRHGKKNAPQEF